jgi:hypothetical protein
MATLGNVGTVDSMRTGANRMTADARPISGIKYELVYIALTAWMVFGAFLDGWAHNMGFVNDSFFTVWHLVLYTGYAAVAVMLGVTHLVNLSKGYAWNKTMPRGFEIAAVGVIVFGVAGAGDLIWHSIFGIETGADATLSPTHMGLIAGAVLIAGAPFRAAWARSADEQATLGRNALLPMILSLTFTYSIIAFILQIYFFATSPLAGRGFITPTSGLDVELFKWFNAIGVVVHTMLLMGFLLLAIKRWGTAIRPGSITLVLMISGLLMTFETMQIRFVPAFILAGIVGDVLRWRLKLNTSNSPQNRKALHFFSLWFPLIQYLFLILTLAITDSIWWTPHAVVGVVVAAGVAGLATSYLVFPSPMPEARAAE